MYAKVEEVEDGYAPVLKVKSAGRIDLGVGRAPGGAPAPQWRP